MSPFSIESSSARVHAMISSFFNQNLQKRLPNLKRKFAKSKRHSASISTNPQDLHLKRKDFTYQTSKSSRSTPKHQFFTQEISKSSRSTPRASAFHPQELAISRVSRKPKDLAFRAPTPIELPREPTPS